MEDGKFGFESAAGLPGSAEEIDHALGGDQPRDGGLGSPSIVTHRMQYGGDKSS